MRWGIRATGSIANKFALTVCSMDSREASLAAVGSRKMDSAREFAEKYHIPAFYDSYEAMVADPQVEAVYISTPNNMHYENCKMCLNAGKHVLCEKPFTTGVAQAEELYRLAEEKGLFIMEAFWIRFLPQLQHMMGLIAQDVIGEVRHARCEYGFIAQGARKIRKFNSDLGGGALLDIGIYNLGFLHMVMGQAPVSFESNVHMSEYGTDDFSAVSLTYPGGRSAHAVQAIGMDLGRAAAVFGTRGAIWLPDFQMARTMTVTPYGGQPYEVSLPWEINGFEYQIREVDRCVRAGMNTSDILKPADSLTVLRLMDEIRESWGMKFSYET